MSLESAINQGRTAAEALMTDSGIMRRPNGRTAIDPVTDGQIVLLDNLFESRAKIQSGGLQAADQQAGERTAVTLRVELHLPIGAPAVQVGDIWEVQTIGASSDPQLVGRLFRVASPVFKSFATARRLEIEEIVS